MRYPVLSIFALMVMGAAAIGCAAEPVPRSLATWGIAPCRLDKDVPRAASYSATLAWRAIAPPALRAKRVAVNQSSVPDGAVPVFFVKDSLLDNDEDPCTTVSPGKDLDGELRSFDADTVAGICRADHGAVICSSNAVREVRKIEEFHIKQFPGGARFLRMLGDASPSLSYLFAHELAHVVLNHPGAFTEGVERIDLQVERKRRIAQLAEICRVDELQMERERDADSRAFEAVKNLFAGAPFRPARTSLIDAISANSEIIYQTSRTLAEWGARYYGAPEEVVPGTKELCAIVAREQGGIILPVFGGDHPLPWSRLANIVNSTGTYVNELRVKQGERPNESSSYAVMGLNRIIDTVRAQAFEAYGHRFCERVAALENGTLDCSKPETLAQDEEGVEISLPSSEEEEEEKILPVNFSPAGSYRDVEAKEAHVLIFDFGSSHGSPSEKIADGEAARMKAAYEAFFREIDDFLHQHGGYWIHESHQPVTSGFNGFGEEYLSQSAASGFARVPASLKISRLKGHQALKRWGPAQWIATWKWSEMVGQAWIDIAPADGGEPWFRVVTKRLPLDDFFDTKQYQGKGPVPTARFAELLRFLRVALERHEGRAMVLRRTPDGSPLRFDGISPQFQFARGDLPVSWESAFTVGDPIKTPESLLLGMIDRMYVNNGTRSDEKQPQEYLAPAKKPTM